MVLWMISPWILEMLKIALTWIIQEKMGILVLMVYLVVVGSDGRGGTDHGGGSGVAPMVMALDLEHALGVIRMAEVFLEATLLA